MATSARIHVLLARETDYAVIIRRGPSKRVCTIGWDRTNNSFTVGQWLNGRIYERRSDLSPDGKRMIYFAMNGKWSSKTGGSWTAIARTPYLKAVGLWAKGDCWHGGGLFLTNNTYWIHHGYGHRTLTAPHAVREIIDPPFEPCYGGECPGVYFLRLQRDGWQLCQSNKVSKARSVYTFEKKVSSTWTLRKLAIATTDHPEGKGCYYDEHQLVNVVSGKLLNFPSWEWAECDRNFFYWAEAGSLYRARPDTTDLGPIKKLHDFNDMTYEPIKAPY